MALIKIDNGNLIGIIYLKNGFIALDFIRPKIWNDEDVGPWYRQNCFLYIKKSWLLENSKWQSLTTNIQFPTNVVHPEVAPKIQKMGLKQWIKLLHKVFLNTFKK